MKTILISLWDGKRVSPTLQRGAGGIAFVGGFFDYWNPWGGAAVTSFRNYLVLNPRASAAYFTWNQTTALSLWIDAQGGDACVVGHSWGGDTAASVVAAGHAVASLTTVDPVSWFRPSYAAVAAHAQTWINLRATGKQWRVRDVIVVLGGAWKNGPADFATRCDSLPVDHVRIMSYWELLATH